jgi:hypothetical protein
VTSPSGAFTSCDGRRRLGTACCAPEVLVVVWEIRAAISEMRARTCAIVAVVFGIVVAVAANQVAFRFIRIAATANLVVGE